MLEALMIAISTYSRVPTPRTEWTEEGMKYSICCFPAVGVIVGAAECLLYIIADALGWGAVLRGCALAVLPLLITGGIHFDGFMDTCDAIHSYRDRAERLAIMKDPHVGAFAVIGAGIYLILAVGVCSELLPRMLPLVWVSFVLSRALSGLAASTFPKARKDGMLRAMTDAVTMRAVGILVVEVILSAALMIIIGALTGALLPAILMLLAAAVMYVIYFFVAVVTFGGTTGDLAGWFLQMAELVMLFAAVLVA